MKVRTCNEVADYLFEKNLKPDEFNHFHFENLDIALCSIEFVRGIYGYQNDEIKGDYVLHIHSEETDEFYFYIRSNIKNQRTNIKLGWKRGFTKEEKRSKNWKELCDKAMAVIYNMVYEV